MSDNEQFESYVPVYDAIPDKWEESRAFIVEQLKKISNAINLREIGWFLDEELLSGQQFIPTNFDPVQYRSIFRKVIDFSPLVIGVNTKAHGIVFDANFTLMHMYAAATNSVAFTAIPIPMNNGNTMSMDVTNINITSSAAYQRCFAVVEYILEA